MYNQNSDLMKQEKFMLPTMIEGDFSAEELAEDADGLQMSFQRVKIPAGGTLQFEMPSDDPDNPDYEKTLVGVILHNHATCAYWPAEAALQPFYMGHMCLYVTPECFDDPPKIPEVYNDATACVWRDGTWQLLEDTSEGFLLFVQSKSKEEAAA